jgi:hypothetical protein
MDEPIGPGRGERACDQALSHLSGGGDLNSRPLRPELWPRELERWPADGTAGRAPALAGCDPQRWNAIAGWTRGHARSWRASDVRGMRSRCARTRFTRWSGASAGAVETSPRLRWRQLPARRDSPRRLQRPRSSGHDTRCRRCDLSQSEQVDVTYRTACRSPDSWRLPSPTIWHKVGDSGSALIHRRWEQPGSPDPLIRRLVRAVQRCPAEALAQVKRPEQCRWPSAIARWRPRRFPVAARKPAGRRTARYSAESVSVSLGALTVDTEHCGSGPARS